MNDSLDSTDNLHPLKPGRYLLRLYVAGQTPRSIQAIRNIKQICEEYLSERYELEVIDLYQQPQLAEGEQIIAVPTLIKGLSINNYHILRVFSSAFDVTARLT